MTDTIKIFHPHQPFFEKMDDLYLEQQDTRVASDTVALFYQFKVESRKADQLFAVPDGCIDLIFECDKSNPQAKICGTVVKAQKSYCQPGTEYFGIRLFPGNSSNLFHCSAHDFVGKEIQLTDIMKDNSKLVETIASASTFEKRIDCFVNNFLNYIPQSKKLPRLLNFLMRRIVESSGQIKIEDLATETGYTARYIQKVFVDYVGISPKLFSRIARFQKSLDSIFKNSEPDISQIVFDLGYYDHSHFLHEFKEFCLFTPSQIIQKRSDYKPAIILKHS